MEKTKMKSYFWSSSSHVFTIPESTIFFHEILFVLFFYTSRTSDIESNKSQNGGLEDYKNISDGIFPHFTTPSIKLSLG